MIDPPSGLDVLELARPDTDGSAPKQRIADATHAQQIVASLLYADRDRADVNARTKGMLDGNAPFSWGELKRQGQTYRTNVNFREGEAMMSDAMTPFYDLFAESDTYFKVIVDEEDATKKARWSRIVTEEFDCLLKEWSGFDWNMQAILYDMVGYGKGFAFWPNKTDWQFQGIRQSRVLVPDQTPSDIDQLELLVFRQSCLVGTLYKSIRNEKAAKSIGWNPKAVLEACQRAMPVTNTSQTPIDYEIVQQELRNHDLSTSLRSSTVQLAHVFVKEFDGRVTHLIVEEIGTVATSAAEKYPQAKFLYKKVGRYENFREAICPIFYDIGDGTWHSIKGLAIKQYPFIEIKNRLNCSVVDNAFLNMSVLVKPLTDKAYQASAIMNLGPLSILPPNLEVTQWGLSGRMEEGLAVERALTDKLQSNLGQYRKPLVEKSGNPVTATQVAYDSGKEAALGKGAVNRFYSQTDMLGETTYKRAANPNLREDEGQNSEALEFQRRCVERGVPKVKLMKPLQVRASRNIGNGSIFLRQQMVAQTGVMLVPMMNEAGRQNWMDDAIAVMAGTEAVDRWNPKNQFSENLQNERAWAVLENAALKERAPVQWTSTQNNMVHAATHLAACMDALQSLQQGGNPAEVASFLQSALQHTQIHLEQLKRDPNQKKSFLMFKQQWDQISQAAGQLMAKLQQQAQQQNKQRQQLAQRQQQMMSDTQMDQYQVNRKIEMQQQKTDAAIEMKREKQNQSLVLADASTASKIQRSNIESASKINRNGESE